MAPAQPPPPIGSLQCNAPLTELSRVIYLIVELDTFLVVRQSFSKTSPRLVTRCTASQSAGRIQEPAWTLSVSIA
jgi:hypothetical protein